MASYQPPPTYADVILVDPENKKPAKFNPIWLNWFLGLTQKLTPGGAGSGTVTDVSVITANGLAGSVANSATTPAITLSTTITGLLKGNGTAISAATSGTDYAPATSGTSILYGNGSGGFSNVTIGTGVSFAAGTLSATGSGGTITSVSGTAGRVSSTGGTTPVIDLVSGIASAGTTGSASLIPVVTIDTYGRVTSITTAANPQGTVTSVGGTGTVNGLSLSGTVTSSGNLTFSGTLDLSSPPAIGGTSAASGKFTTIEGTDTTDASSTTTAALKTAGGLAVVKKIYVGDNIVIATSGKGIDFSATAGTGTSELFADYEEGTWTPTDASGAGLIFTLGSCTYTKVGRMVTCYAVITFPVTASAANAKIGGFPFTPSDRAYGQIAYTSISTALVNYAQGAGAFVFLWTPGALTTNASMSGGLIIFSTSFNV